MITGSNARTFRENGAGTIHTYRATDPEGDEFTWIPPGGDDGHLFDISDRGALTFKEPPDYDDPLDSTPANPQRDNVYKLTVQAEDDQSNTGELEVTITVTDLNEGPEVSERTEFFVQEYTEPTLDPQTQILATYTATDPEGSAVTRWSLTGRDGGDFNISNAGALTFRNAPDYDRPADSNRDNIYELTVRAYDATNRYGSLDATVTVLEVNEAAPVVTGRENHTVRENTTAALYTYRATDADRDTTIMWSAGGTDGNLFEVNDRGAR